jgi:hypothetical protein
MAKSEIHEIAKVGVEMHKFNMTLDKRKRHDNNDETIRMVLSVFNGIMDNKKVQLIIAALLAIQAYKVYKEEKRKDKLNKED